MTISYPLTLPVARKPRQVVFHMRNVVGVNTAPTSLVAQRYKFPGERWELDISMPLMPRADGEAWVGFLTSLQGPLGSFYIGDPAHPSPRGTISGSVLVNGAHSAGSYTLALSGGSGSFAVGDWLQLTHSGIKRLYKALSTGGGGSSLDLWPSLRGSVSNGDAVTITNCVGKFMLTGMPEYTLDSAGRYQIGTFTAVEDLS